MHLLERIARKIDACNDWIGRWVSWLTSALVVLFCADVAMRYVLRKSFASVFELEWHIFALIFLLTVGYTLRHDKHVRVDVLYGRMSPHRQAMVNLLGVVLFLLPLCVLVIKTSLLFVYNSWIIGEGSPDPGGLPARYLIKAAIPVGFALLALQAISLAIHSLITIAGTDKPSSHE